MKGSEITKTILTGLLVAGTIAVAASSPYFARRLPRALYSTLKKKKLLSDEPEKFDSAFYYMRHEGYIDIRSEGNQIYVYLTKEGEKRAGKYRINHLRIEKPKKWDGLWRVVVFDVPDLTRIKREALRGKLKELGFRIVQKSVWAHPYPCREEINLLRDFFGLTVSQLSMIEGKIDDDKFFRHAFGL